MDPKASVIIGLLDSVDIQQNSAAVAATIQTRVHVLQRQQVALEQRIASISPKCIAVWLCPRPVILLQMTTTRRTGS